MSRVHNKCLKNKDWSKEKCNISYNKQYTLTEVEKPLNIFFAYVTDPLLEVISTFEDIVYELIEDKESPEKINRPEGLRIREELKSLINQTSKNQKLNSCQKACVIKCVTSNYIDYELPQTPMGSTNHLTEIYFQAKGKCTEFSRMANDLSKDLGIKTRSVSNLANRHSYNEIEIDGNWFQFEPQSHKCDFFNPTKIEVLGESETRLHEINDIPKEFNLKSYHVDSKELDFTKSLKR